jgi:hypothetical protein
MTHQPENTRALVDRVARQIARDVYGFGTAMTLARYSSEAIEEQHRKIAQAAIEAIAENTRVTPLDAAQEIDTGDVVLHKPSGEQWLVAFVEGDMLCACGWPESLAPLADCTLVTRATPEARISLLHEMARSSGARASYANRALAAPSFRDALEFAAKHFNSDWPERCQSIVLCARAALRAAPPQPDTRATPGVQADRDAFEQAMRPSQPNWTFEDDGTGGYHHKRTDWAWQGWQAALASEAGKAPAKPAAFAKWAVGEEYDKRMFWIAQHGDPKTKAWTADVRWSYLYAAPNAAKGPAPSLVHSAEASLGAVQRPERETER